MGVLNIGKNIADLRRQKGITQENLAEIVGVTGQAISKWENGGSPDVELLQPIADYFGVSIDRLFGRKVREYGDIEAELAESIINIDDMNKRLLKVFDYAWVMEHAIMGDRISDSVKNLDDVTSAHEKPPYSQVFLNKGITSLGIDKALRYFLIMPEPDDGWGRKLHFQEEYCKLFSLLSDEAALKTIFFLYARNNKGFTPKLLEKECGISQEKAVDILSRLMKIKLIYTSEIEIDDTLQLMYNFNANAAFIPFLTFAGELLNRPQSFQGFYWHRNTAFLGTGKT